MDEPCKQLIADLEGERVRRGQRAARALGDASQLPCLEAAFRDPTIAIETKRELGEILYRARRPEAVPLLIEQLGNDDAGVRSIVVQALGAIGDQVAGPALVRVLEDMYEPTIVRDCAAFSLGQISYHPAWSVLTKYLDDPAKTVRYCSARSLRLLNEPQSRTALTEALRTEESTSVRSQIEEALRIIRLPPPIDGMQLG